MFNSTSHKGGLLVSDRPGWFPRCRAACYRLITEINYQTGRIFLRHVLTHAEYHKGGWKTWAR